MASPPESISEILSRVEQTMQNEFNSRPNIQRVSPHLGEGDKYTKYYKPKLISIGPIHHGDPNLKRGEQYKLMWAAMFVRQNGQDPRVLRERVLDAIAYLRKLFSWDKIDRYNDEDLASMLFVDGCSVMQILQKCDHAEIGSLNIELVEMILVRRDLLLLENQLPYEVLQLLVDDEMKLKMLMRRFCLSQNMFIAVGSITLFVEEWDQDSKREIIELCFPSIHLLDCLRKIILYNGTLAEPQVVLNFSMSCEFADKQTYRSVGELKAAAIRMKKQSKISLRDISLSSCFFRGKLHLPPLILDESTVLILMNLVAYEMCSGFKNDFAISSYVKFLDLLIDHPEDVKELREAGILQNSLGSDEEVSKLFNTIGSQLVRNKILYHNVKSDIEKHYQRKLSVWIAEALHTHFKSPWSVIALLAATALLVLTIIQTCKAF